MAALTATDWTITYPSATNRMNGRYYDTEIIGKKRLVSLKMSLAATGTVPAGGVPFPPYTKCGMVRNLDTIILHHHITQNFTTSREKALTWEINTTGRTFKAFRYTLASSTAAASGGRAIRTITGLGLAVNGANVFYVTAVGW